MYIYYSYSAKRFGDAARKYGESFYTPLRLNASNAPMGKKTKAYVKACGDNDYSRSILQDIQTGQMAYRVGYRGEVVAFNVKGRDWYLKMWDKIRYKYVSFLSKGIEKRGDSSN